jgi:hypothetical protein
VTRDDIETKLRYEYPRDGGNARIRCKIVVQGVECADLVIASGPDPDLWELWTGEITLSGLQARWSTKVKR